MDHNNHSKFNKMFFLELIGLTTAYGFLAYTAANMLDSDHPTKQSVAASFTIAFCFSLYQCRSGSSTSPQEEYKTIEQNLDEKPAESGTQHAPLALTIYFGHVHDFNRLYENTTCSSITTFLCARSIELLTTMAFGTAIGVEFGFLSTLFYQLFFWPNHYFKATLEIIETNALASGSLLTLLHIGIMVAAYLSSYETNNRKYLYQQLNQHFDFDQEQSSRGQDEVTINLLTNSSIANSTNGLLYANQRLANQAKNAVSNSKEEEGEEMQPMQTSTSYNNTASRFVDL
ncbi:MAG: hypothetical protein ACE365_07045 [Gammaproteobacteria bacterium]